MAVTTTFSPSTGVLTVTSDALDDTIAISRDAAGAIFINGGAVPISGGFATVVNTTSIQVLGQGGEDAISLNEANGALPTALLLGGTGNDHMTWNPGIGSDTVEGGDGTDTAEIDGGNGPETFAVTANGTRVSFDRVSPAPFHLDIGTTETLVVNMNGGDDSFSATGNLAALIAITVDGGAGNDTILGSNGADMLLGGDGDDFVDGNQGNDTIFLGAGNDTVQWDPGDGSDVVEGQAGTDTLVFNGSNINENIDISANGSRVRFFRDVGNVTQDINGVETITFNAVGGADIVRVHDLTGTDATQVIVKLSATLGGSAGDGVADQVFVDGTAGGDTVTIASVGGLAGITGLAATVVLSNPDIGLDVLTFNALGGNDSVTVNDLSGTSLTLLNIDLANGGIADGQADQVVVNGTTGGDALAVTAAGTTVNVSALGASVGVLNADPTLDTVAVNGLGGNDTITAGNGLAALIRLTIDGGVGNDTIVGGDGADVLIGNDGNDSITGGRGNDVAFLGAGDDQFIWNPGDGSDVVEGQAGTDTLVFNGSNINENIDISANGSRVRFFRDVGNVTQDINGVETITFNAVGGADIVRVHDLTGTDATQVNVNLSATLGGIVSDGVADQVFVDGTAGGDSVTVTAVGTGVSVTGLPASVAISSLDAGLDTLTINLASGGADGQADRVVVNATAGADNLTIAGGSVIVSGLAATVSLLNTDPTLDTVTVNGLDGNDTITAGNELVAHIKAIIDGGSGIDTAVFGGPIGSFTAASYNGEIAVLSVANNSHIRLFNIEKLKFSDQTIDVSAVAPFDPLSYIASYGDLIAAFHTNGQAGFDHYIDFGFGEGRQATFDALGYIASYGDLIQALGASVIAGETHFIQFGFDEGRHVTFDALEYLASNGDLIQALGLNLAGAEQHYIQHGFFEGRPTHSFDALEYIASNGDLIQALGLNLAGAEQHYIQHGFFEGRATHSFDPLDYIASYGDLIQAFGTNTIAAEQHFIQFGFNEGRHASFDALDYIASYGDLIQAFGTNTIAAEQHFIQFGFNEGRHATFDGLQYIASYGDLIQALGANDTAGQTHFIQFGFNEGRHATFNAEQYLANYADLQAAFGDDPAAAETHFITNGHSEGRTDQLLPGATVGIFVGNAGPNAMVVGSGDTMTGGAGNDTFIFRAPLSNLATITDFTQGADVLQIAAAGFGGGLVPGGPVAVVTATDASLAFHPGSSGYFIFDNAGADAGTVLWDANGGSGADAVALVKLTGVASLPAANFHVV